MNFPTYTPPLQPPYEVKGKTWIENLLKRVLAKKKRSHDQHFDMISHLVHKVFDRAKQVEVVLNFV